MAQSHLGTDLDSQAGDTALLHVFPAPCHATAQQKGPLHLHLQQPAWSRQDQPLIGAARQGVAAGQGVGVMGYVARRGRPRSWAQAVSTESRALLQSGLLVARGG